MKHYFYDNLNSSNQVKTFVKGLQMIQDYSSVKKIKYDYVFCTRMDLKYSGNILPLLCGNRGKVTVTRHLGYPNSTFCDFIHLIDPIVLDRYIKHMSGDKGSRLMQCITDPIYHYYRFNKRRNNWIMIDREYTCSQYVNTILMKSEKA